MDRLNQLRGEAGGSRDSTLDTTSPPSEAFMTANESSSKYYSLSEVDSTFDISSIKDDISSIKDVSLASAATESEGTITNADELISNLSPIGKKSDILDSYKIDTQIEAANILSGGVAIFDDNDNSYDGDELVIDDNADIDEKSNSELKQPDSLQFKPEGNIIESSLISEEADIASKDTEVVLQIDGNNVDAIDIGNGLYLYRKEGHEELAAVQINDDDQQQPSFKFLKVRENTEGNLEVYEEIEIEVPKEVPAKEVKMADKNTPSHVPIMDINKVISDSASNKVADRKNITPKKEAIVTTTVDEIENKESSPDNKSEVNLNGKTMKFTESRKSPIIGSFTPMTYHSTPNKEGKPLTKTMVDQQLHTNRHSDLSNVKKTIEVHTDSSKQKNIETSTTNKDSEEIISNLNEQTEKESEIIEVNENDVVIDEQNPDNAETKESCDTVTESEPKSNENKVGDINTETKIIAKDEEIPLEQDIVITSPKVADNKLEDSIKVNDLKDDRVDEKDDIVDEKEKDKVNEKEDKADEKDDKIYEKDGKIDEKENKIVGKKDNICEKEDNIVEKEDKIVEKEDKIVEKENKIVEKEDKIVEKEDKIVEKEDKIVEKEDKIVEKEDKIVEKEDKIVEKEEKIVEKVDKNVEKEDKNVEKEDKISEKEDKILEKEDKIEQETDKIDEKDEKVDEKVKQVYEKDNKLDKKENKVDEKVEVDELYVSDSKVDEKEGEKLDKNLTVVDEAVTHKRTELIQVDENKILDKESNKMHEGKVEEVIELDSDHSEAKYDPMEIDDEIESEIAKTLTCVDNTKVTVEDSNKIQHNAAQEEVISEKQELILNVGKEPIVIEDDVSEIEEVIIDKKDDNVRSLENTVVDTTIGTSIDGKNENVASTENILKASDDEIKYVKEMVSENKDSKDKETQAAVSPVKSTVRPDHKKESPAEVFEGVKKDVVDICVQPEQEEQKETVSPSLPVKNISIKDTISVHSSVNLNKGIDSQTSQQDVIVKSTSKELQSGTETLQVSVAEHTINPIKSVESKDLPTEIVRHNIPSQISPLLAPKHASLVAPKAIKVTPVAKEIIELTKPLILDNATITSNLKIESKILNVQTTTRKEPINLTQLGSVPVVAQVQKDYPVSSTTIKSRTQPPVVIQDKDVQKISSVVEKKVTILPIKSTTIDKPPLTSEFKRAVASNKDDRKDLKLPLRDHASEKVKNVMNIEITKVPKVDAAKMNTIVKQDVSSSSSKTTQVAKSKIDPKDKRELPKVVEAKPINNNHAAVPFGKWTEANRQEFLNKFKTKTSVISSSSNQLKNSNDLNRRDVLKKIDSQRQSNNALSKTQEANKLNIKPETAAFSNKPNIINKEIAQETKKPQKTETVEVKPKPVEVKSKPVEIKPKAPKNITKVDVIPKTVNEPSHAGITTSAPKKEVCQRTGVVQNLIDKTIEGMIHRSLSAPKTQDEPKQSTNKELSVSKPNQPQQTYPQIEQATLDAIEMTMNELHGIPFIERPPHELPKVHKAESKSYSKVEKEKVAVPKTKIPNLLPFPNKPPPTQQQQQKVVKDAVIEVDSEDEIIEHEPITGDMALNKKNQVVKPPAKEKLPSNIVSQIQQEKLISDAAKKDAIITEKDFDKFARRNSITYENRNCITVNFDGKEPHNVVQTVVEKDLCPKNYSKNDASRVDNKPKLPYKYQNVRTNAHPNKLNAVNKFGPSNDDASNRNQSKLQKAYHSALTAKRQLAAECPITIIEDKPVKVVFIDNVDYVPSQLNVQGQDLSPAKRAMPESEVTVSTCDSLDSDMLLDSIEETKSQDDTKIKTKHQRKQVLTPVDEPELELIEPSDLGIEVSPKKKRKTDDDKTDKNKYPMRKKLYMLSSSAVTEEKVTNPVDVPKNPLKETVNLNDISVAHKNPVSALDSLVKAAELIETQTENMNNSIVSNPDSQSSTPVKRGRGRPRKYPITPDGTLEKVKPSTPSPQKKPRLIDAKIVKHDDFTDDSDSDGEIIKENWTMGKINENIVCPICNKLFRTENVVFKHVKHCTGPSPSRSDSDKRSPRRVRISQDFDTKSRESKSDDMDLDDDKPLVTKKETPKKRKSKDSTTKSDDKDDIIVIEDTPIKEKPVKIDERKQHESRKPKTKIPHKNNDLICEFCGKTFRQLSYLVSHKLQHKKQEKTEPKKTEKDAPVPNKSVYSCEVCKKEFRKLHHLVQHRIIHNPSSAPSRYLRKSSSEQSDNKTDKEPSTSKQSEDPSAGFRCEPCDKSFRKLHHLVEHRETHDGINRQKTTTAPPNKEEKAVEKPVILHTCDICKKTFKKLQHLNEHKEQHVETSSEKSDDKSVKSSLSTRDIIHECSLCYMVFPNEHSLNKHTIICQRKKRQSKQLKPTDETEGGEEVTESPPPEEKSECVVDSPKPIFEIPNKDEGKREDVEKVDTAKEQIATTDIEVPKEKPEEAAKVLIKEKNTQKIEPKVSEQQVPPVKRDFVATETVKTEVIPEVPEKIRKIEEKEPAKIHETPKKKTPMKDKTPNKRLKTVAAPPPAPEIKPTVESSDDDEIRYMLNPNFKAEDVSEEKVFMKVRAKKRSSLQIERPNSKDLVKRRTSLQHPPKIPRLKPKAVETNTATIKKETKTPKLEPVPSTDSDDSETTKYSFPSTIPEKSTKPTPDRTLKDSERKTQRKSLADKRKSLSGIAKRKTLGKVVTARHKPSPIKQVKKRTLDAEHRCDCGQLFSSAALLSRHTTLAHTPPRIRRRRSPPPEEKPIIKPAPRKSSTGEKPKQSPVSRKSSARSDSSASANTKPSTAKSEVKPGRKSQVKDTESPTDSRKAKPEKSEAKSSVKPRRTGAHRGVPVPDKMKKLMQRK